MNGVYSLRVDKSFPRIAIIGKVIAPLGQKIRHLTAGDLVTPITVNGKDGIKASLICSDCRVFNPS
jgi:hypothetical protein